MEEGCFVTVYDFDRTVLIKDQHFEPGTTVAFVKQQVAILLKHDRFRLQNGDSILLIVQKLSNCHHDLLVVYHTLTINIDLPNSLDLLCIYASYHPVKFIYDDVRKKLGHDKFTLRMMGETIDLEKPLGCYQSNRFYVVLYTDVIVRFRGLVVLSESVKSFEILYYKLEQLIGHCKFLLYQDDGKPLSKMSDSITLKLCNELEDFTDSVLWEILKTKN